MHAAKRSGASDCETIGFAPTRVVLQEMRKATTDLTSSVFNVPNVEKRTRYFDEILQLIERVNGNLVAGRN